MDEFVPEDGHDDLWESFSAFEPEMDKLRVDFAPSGQGDLDNVYNQP